MSDNVATPGAPSAKEALFFMSILNNMKNKPEVDWALVAEASGMKNAKVAATRFSQIKNKWGAVGGGDGSTASKSTTPKKPKGVTKKTTTPKSKKTKVKKDEEPEDDAVKDENGEVAQDEEDDTVVRYQDDEPEYDCEDEAGSV